MLLDIWQQLRSWLNPHARPAPGQVRFGHLRRLTPISRHFGLDRGLPIDRYYVERFLAEHAVDIRGSVLEVGDDLYTRQYGGDAVNAVDVLHVTAGNPKATIVADLTDALHIPANRFDCIVLTQTLHLVYDVQAALHTLHRILKPGGVLLATFPGISQISRDEWRKCWYWGFTSLSSQRLFTEVFQADKVEIQAHGNVLASIAFLHGVAAEEMRSEELLHRDPQYELVITARATKAHD